MHIIAFTILLILVADSHQRTFDELTEVWQALILKHSEKCINETGVDPVLAARITPYGEYVEDYKLMCFMRCIMDNLFVIYDDSSVHYDNLLEILHIQDPRIIEKSGFIEKCFELQMPDQCEKMFHISKCVYFSVKTAMEDNPE